jgi:hypothetical protein
VAHVIVVLTVLPLPTPSREIVKEQVSPNIFFEEYGFTSVNSIVQSIELSLLRSFITVLVLSLIEYSAVKAYYLSVRGEVYSLVPLLREALSKIPGVVLVNVLAYLTSFLLGVVPLGITVVGALTLSPVLALLGVLVLLAIFPVVLTFFALVVPAYVEANNIGTFVEALGLTFKNLPSSLGYGILIVLLGFAVAIVMAPFLLPLGRGSLALHGF